MSEDLHLGASDRSTRQLESAEKELHRIYSAMDNIMGTAPQVYSVIIIVLAAVGAVATRRPYLGAMVAPLWGALLMQAAINDYNVNKLSAIARKLEVAINEALRQPGDRVRGLREVYIFESRLSGRGGFDDPALYRSFGAYTLTLNLLAWMYGEWALRQVASAQGAPTPWSAVYVMYLLLWALCYVSIVSAHRKKNKKDLIDRAVNESFPHGNGLQEADAATTPAQSSL